MVNEYKSEAQQVKLYKIEHVPVLKDYRHPTNPVNSKKEVRFYYHHKYIQFVKRFMCKK